MQETTFTPVLVIFLCMALRLYCQKEASYTRKRSRDTFETEKLFFCTRADPQYLYAVLHRIFQNRFRAFSPKTPIRARSIAMRSPLQTFLLWATPLYQQF